MSFTGWAPSMPHRRRALLTRQGIAREAVECESTYELVRLVPRHGVAHGLAADWRGFEPPGPPTCIEIEALDRGQPHDRGEVGSHVGHPRPLPVDLDVRKKRKELEHVGSQRLREVQRRACGMQLVRIQRGTHDELATR